MKKLFWGFIIVFFASLILWAQEPVKESENQQKVFPPLAPVESPIPKPTVIQPEAPKEKPEDKISRELPGLAPVAPPEVVPAPQRQIQQFPALSPVTPPEDVVGPQRATQRFPVLSPVTAPAFQDQVGSTLRRFQELSPVTAPISHHRQGGISDNPGNPGQLAYAKQSFASLPQVGAPSSVYRTFRLSDFSGGLNKRDFPTEIADNEVTELINFVWEGKKLRSRDGFTTYYDMSEFHAGEEIRGLYRYYKRDGSKILIAGVDSGAFADTIGAGGFVLIKGGLRHNGKFYYFETFKDRAIVTHEGDYPFWYDGDSVDYVGLADSGRGGLVVRDGVDVDTCLSFVLTGDTKLTIETRPHRPDEKARRRRTEGAPTQYDRYNVKFYETDRWVGYTLEFVDSLGSSYWYYVTANIEDTIYLEGQNLASTNWTGTYYIYSYFDYEYVASGAILSDPTGNTCQESLRTYVSCTTVEPLVSSGLVGRMKTGFSAGQERFIVDAFGGVASCTLVFTSKFDSLSLGYDNIRVLRKRFWKPALVKIFKNRIFFANLENYPNLVVFSAYNRIGDFPPDNYFVVKTQDGDYITALATFYEDQLGYKQSKDCLVIFKQNSIYKLVWNSATDYAVVQVVEGVGCVAPQTVVNVEGKYLLFLHTSGIYAFDGRTVIPVYLNIQPLLADSINQSKINLASAGYCDRHYYLSYPAGTSTENNRGVVFNIDLGAWGETDNLVGGIFAQQNAISDTVKLLFSDPRAKSFIYQFGKVATDTGQPISLTLKSKAFNLGDLHKRKRFTYFDLDYYLDSDSARAWFYTDFGDSLRYSTYFSESGGNRHARIPLDADCLGRNFSFKLTSNKWFELGSVAFKFREIGE